MSIESEKVKAMYTDLVGFLLKPAVYSLQAIVSIFRSFFAFYTTPIKTKKTLKFVSKNTSRKSKVPPRKSPRLKAMAQELDSMCPNQELCVVLSLGHDKHIINVRRETTVEELANLVFLEVLKEAPPSTGLTLGSAFRLVFRGRQLMTPTLTMGALRVKNGEKIMVLMNQSHRRNSPNKIENSSSSSSNASLKAAASSNENADHNSKGDSKKALPETPSSRIQALKEKAEQLMAEVQPLSQDIQTAVASGAWESKALSNMVKKVHLCNVELMHVLEDLADISLVHLEDAEDLRKKRKALVDRIVASQNSLDAVIVSGNKALGK